MFKIFKVVLRAIIIYSKRGYDDLDGCVTLTLYSDHIKVKLSLCLTELHAMKVYWGSGGTALRILNLGARWR
jgi:hypothetical protein